MSADAIFVDELDRMDITSIPYFDKRLEHSNRKWQRWGSTPTVPNFGIHKLYLDSSKNEYFIKCKHCGEWQVLTFDSNVDKEKFLLVCNKCRQQVIPWECQGEWKTTDGNSKIKGYHISQLYSPMLNLAKLIESSKQTSEWEVQQFYNQNLGLPYEPKGAKITEQDISACKRDYFIPFKIDKEKSKGCFIGIDVGRVLHIVIMEEKRIVFIGEKETFEEVNNLINEYNVKVGVVDALPETRKAQELANRFRGRILLSYYSGIKEVKEGEWFKFEAQKVNTDRTLSLDMTVNKIKTQEIEVPKNIDDYLLFKSHLKNLIRVVEESQGNKVAEYIQTGDDHYFHALNYANLAQSIFKKVPIIDVFVL